MVTPPLTGILVSSGMDHVLERTNAAEAGGQRRRSRRRSAAPVYRKILVPLDHSALDRAAIAHAAYLARLHNATLYLLHVEEGATSRLFGPIASDAEVQTGEEYFQGIVDSLAQQGLAANLSVVYGQSPKDEIVKLASQLQPDLIVMGAHGHRGVKDLILGNTINRRPARSIRAGTGGGRRAGE